MKSVILVLLIVCSFATDDVQPEEGIVTVITLDNYESIVTNSEKDVLLDFYAPWCGHWYLDNYTTSQRLEPVYNELASLV